MNEGRANDPGTLFDDPRDDQDEQLVTAAKLSPHAPEDVRPDCDCPLCVLVGRVLRSFG